MNDIQQARDVLAKWRDDIERADQVWSLSGDARGLRAVVDDQGTEITDNLLPGDARLIVGVAGNPELLDAIDGMLSTLVRAPGYFYGTAFAAQVERIAAAIIAADERTSA